MDAASATRLLHADAVHARRFNLWVIQIHRVAAIATFTSTIPTLENLTRLPIFSGATLFSGCRSRALIVV
jgi:hypothetical protein